MNYTYHTLSLLYHLSVVEKTTILILIAITLTLFVDLLISTVKKQKNKRMISHYLFIKHEKWNDLIKLLTDNNPFSASDIQTKLEIDISKFDSKYRDILYHELIKIKQSQDINPTNWDLLIKLLFDKNIES